MVPDVGKWHQEQVTPSYIAVGALKPVITLENSLAVSYKVKYIVAIWLGSSIPEYSSKGNENMHLHNT